MDIKKVQIFKANSKKGVLAYANVIIDDCFIIKGIKLIETEKSGKFIAMPSRRLINKKAKFIDVCHPLNAEIRKEFTDKIFEAYEKFIEE